MFTGVPAGAFDPSPVGIWRTIDDKTHRARGLVRLYQRDGEIFGRIEASLIPEETKEVCSLCTDDRKDKPVIGMEFLRNMKRHGDEYRDGDILDPDTGQVYRCKFTMEDGGQKLVVRGFIGISLLGRSQTWFRQE